MADSLLVPIHVEALFVPARNAPAQESRVSPPAPPQKNKPGKDKKEKESNKGQEKKQEGGRPPEASDPQPAQDQRSNLLPGVHLHWFLPFALTRGIVEEDKTIFPVVPNRWLVTRQDRSGIRQWVVESDYIHPEGMGENCIAYPLDQRMDGTSIPYRRLGRSMRLDELDDLLKPKNNFTAEYLKEGLTAIGYGIPTFASYYPHCHSVFGFYDGDFRDAFSGDLKYSVIGWYGDPEDDFLMKLNKDDRKTVDVLKEDFGWQIPAASSRADPGRMFCYGVTSRPMPDFKSEPRKIAVANSGVDALSAYLAAVISGKNEEQRALLEEQLEFLSIQPSLVNDPLDLEAKFLEGQHERGFNAVYGGSQWTIQPARRPDHASRQAQKKEKVKLTPGLARELAELNRRQREYDLAMQEITDLQQQLSSDWHKHMPRPDSPKGAGKQKPGIDKARFEQARNIIETQHIKPLKGKIAASKILKKELDKGIPRHNQQEGTEPFTLKQIPAARYWQPKEPVVLIAGEGEPDFLKRMEGPLDCRIVQGSGDEQKITKQTLDRILKQATGLSTFEGHQPWPLFLEWVVGFLPEENSKSAQGYPEDFLTRNFEWNNKKAGLKQKKLAGKNWKSGPGGKAGGTEQVYRGASILTPHAGELLKQRVVKYLQPLIDTKGSPGAPGSKAGLPALRRDRAEHKSEKEEEDDFQKWLGEKIDDVIKIHENTPLGSARGISASPDPISTYLQAFKTLQGEEYLSQALSGFNDLLVQKETLQLSSDDPLGLVSERETGAAGEPSPIRAGEMEIRSLRLVDTFGRVKEIFGQFKTVSQEVIISQHLRDLQEGPNRMALPPRLVQPTRLNFRWLAAESIPQAKGKKNNIETAQEMNAHPDTHPICGWLLPGFLDNSLMVYDASGSALGLVTARTASLWLPTPDSKTTRVDQIANPHLRKVVEYITGLGRNSGALESFLRMVEMALESIAPAGEETALAMLLGHPVAVVRASLDVEMFGGPPKQRATGAVRIPIRMGAEEQLDDSLIGYWLEDKQGALSNGFLTPQTGIELAFNDAPRILTMLMDPHGKVHASSGILPVKTIDIPADQYSDLLQHLAVTFLAAPLLTGQNEMDLPVPHEPGRGWTWLDSRDGTWKPVNQPTQQAFAALQEIREVWLKITTQENQPDNNLLDKDQAK